MIEYYLKEMNKYSEACEVSEFGCCEYTESCYVYSEYEYDYSILEYDVENDIVDKDKINQEKLNIKGDNCVSINEDYDMIRKVIEVYLEKLHTNDVEGMIWYVIFYSFIYVVIECMLFWCKDKIEKDYEKMSGSV